MTRWLSALVLTLALHPGVARGELADADRAWMVDVLSSWRTVSRQDLGLKDRPIPWVVFFDQDRVWHVNFQTAPLVPEDETPIRETLIVDEEPLPVLGFSHHGGIVLPDGDHIPAQLILFASTYGDPPSPYFVMAMPAIWRATPRHAQDTHLEALIAGVFVHEITHTQQSHSLGSRVDALVAAHGLDDDEVDDDLVQRRFADRPGYREAYERERDLLFAAAAAESDSTCRVLARRAHEAIAERRSRWFVGDETFYGELEDIFLNFEGVANWAAYRALIARGVAPEQALPELRRGGKWWSQDEGLALLLVLDRLDAPWRQRVFSADPGSILAMLADVTR
jgi:hypothetical protein